MVCIHPPCPPKTSLLSLLLRQFPDKTEIPSSEFVLEPCETVSGTVLDGVQFCSSPGLSFWDDGSPIWGFLM